MHDLTLVLSAPLQVNPDDKEFSGFVFKLQANMDPKHRDRIAFVRVCSGRFDKDMQVLHTRTGKTVRLSAPSKLFAQKRETLETAYAGDIVGFVNPGAFSIGALLSRAPCTPRVVYFRF